MEDAARVWAEGVSAQGHPMSVHPWQATGLTAVGVCLRQSCALSPILFVIFVDRVARRNCEGVGGIAVWWAEDCIAALQLMWSIGTIAL